MNRQDKPPQRPNTRPAEIRPASARPTDTRSSRTTSSNASAGGRRRRRPPPQSSSLNWRSLLMVALVCALTGFVVIFVYEWYKKNERIETIKAFEQEQVEKKEKIVQSALFAERLRETILRASGAKTAIVEHYAVYGVFPSSFSQLGMMPEELVPSEWAEDIKIENDGVLAFTFSPQTGDKKVSIKLTPNVSHGAIRWTCATPDYAQIGDIVYECIYTGAGGTEQKSSTAPRSDTIRTPTITTPLQIPPLAKEQTQGAVSAKYTYKDPIGGAKARLRVSGGYFTGTPNLVCMTGFRGHPDELKKMLEDAGPDVKLTHLVEEFGVLLGTNYLSGHRGRRIGIPVSNLNTQEVQAEVYIAAGKPFTLGFVADTERGTVCGYSHTFTPQANKDYEAVGEITQNKEGKVVGCQMSIHEIKGGTSKPVEKQGQCIGPASFSRILGK